MTKHIDGRLTAFCSLTGDGKWRPVVEIELPCDTHEAAMEAGKQMIARGLNHLELAVQKPLRKRKRKASAHSGLAQEER